MSALATVAVLPAPVAAPVARPAALPAPTRPYRRTSPLGDPTPLVCTVARTALEVACGAEGIITLTRWVTPELRAQLQRQYSLARRAGYTSKGRVGIVRVRLCRVGPSAVEAAIVAMEGEVAHAIAMRLEDVTGRWLVTALEIG